MNFLNSLTSYSDWGLLALRLAIGAVFVVHGKGKMGMWKMKPNGQMKAPMTSMMKLLSVAEPLGGIALAAGFLTELAALGLGVIMLGALYFKMKVWKMAFKADNATGWEFDLVLLAGCLALLTSGAGAYSLDQWLR